MRDREQNVNHTGIRAALHFNGLAEHNEQDHTLLTALYKAIVTFTFMQE